jgi:chorismate mutase/prephenate dehydratase
MSDQTPKKEPAERSLDLLRAAIDRIDDRILDLLNERAGTVQEVGRVKEKATEPFYDQGREKKILERLRERNTGPFPQEGLRAIFREIISASRSLEAPMTICYLGPEATFAHAAAIRHFGKSSQYVPMIRVEDIFTEVEKGNAHFGVLPIENSTEGVVHRTVDLFLDSSLKICAEICVNIQHNLLSNAELKSIRKIYSHPQALAQCRNWISQNLPWAEVLPTSSTARGVEDAVKEPDSAAIASELASTTYGLPIVVRAIEDSAWNQTRFVVVGPRSPDPTGYDKTSVVIFLKDEPGALFRALRPFEIYGINLCGIESRPSRREAWKYMFYIDFEGHVDDPQVIKAFDELEKHALYAKVLGSYPRDLGVLRADEIRED